MPQCLQGLHCNTHCLMSVTHSKIWMKATKCTLTLSRKNTARMIPVAQFQWKTKEQAKEAFSSQRRPKEKTAETIAVMTWHKGTWHRLCQQWGASLAASSCFCCWVWLPQVTGLSCAGLRSRRGSRCILASLLKTQRGRVAGALFPKHTMRFWQVPFRIQEAMWK